MNGISLAALLGAATWFGVKELREKEPDDVDSRPADVGPSTTATREVDGGEYEFLWPSGPMFQ